MKRVWAGIALGASLVLGASPVVAAEVYHYSSSGSGLSAYFTNVDWSAEELPPGEYFETYVDAASYISDGADTYGDGLCVWHLEFTIDGEGNWVDESSLGACGEASELSIDRRLTTGHVAGTIPVIECTEWDEQTEECLAEEYLGDFEVDLTVTGAGPLYRHHGASSGGTAGYYQYTWNGSGVDRSGTPSGTVDFDEESIIDGATSVDGYLWSSREGGVDVSICRPSSGC